MSVWGVVRALRKVHSRRQASPVDECLRGYRCSEPPVRPRAFLDLSMWDVVYRQCPTGRDLWLRKREGIPIEVSDAMKKGAAIHRAFHETSRVVARAVLSGYDPWDAYEVGARLCSREFKCDEALRRVCKGFAFLWSAMVSELGCPVAVTEMVVDGSSIGLSRYLRVDALFEGSVVIELKYGSFRREYAIAVAGYAMALESFLEIPIDFGLVVTVNGDGSSVRVYPVYVDDSLRKEFLELRDEAIDVLLSDVEPPKPPKCPPTCPYRRVCLGGGHA